MKLSVVIGLAIFVAGSFFGYKYLKKNIEFNSSSQIRYIIAEKITSFDPAVAFDDYSLLLLSQTYEALYQYHYLKRPYEIVPLLAEDLPKVSKDGTRFIIKIKQNIPYHDHPAFKGSTRYLKAQDFVNQIKRIAFKPVNSKGRWLFEGKVKGFNEFSDKIGDDLELMLSEKLEGVIAKDEYTLEFQLTKKDLQFPHYLTMNFLVPIPEEVIRYTHNDLKDSLTGTGPYYLDSWIEDKEYHLKKFKGYREDFYPTSGDRYANTKNLLSRKKLKIPIVENLFFIVEPSSQKQWEMLIADDVDILEVPPEYVSLLTDTVAGLPEDILSRKIQLKYAPSLSARWLGFNMNDPIVGGEKNYLLRKAIAYAIDRRAYKKEIFQNNCLEANSIFNPGILGHDPSQQLPYQFNLAKAKEFLTEAGYPEGKGLPELVYSTRNTRASGIVEAEFFKDQLKKIGIKVKINPLDWGDFQRLARAGKLQMWTDGWIYDYPDAENILQLLISSNHPGNNKSAYHNPKVDQLYESYISEPNQARKVEILHELEEKVLDDLPWIMLTYQSAYLLHQNRLKNFRHSSIIRNFMKYIEIEE